MHGPIGREQRGAVAGGEPNREVDVEATEQRCEVVPPRDRDRHVPNRVLQNQVPADDPRHQLAEGCVGVRIGAPRLGNHRRQLGVTQPGEGARDAQQQEGEHKRGTGAAAHEMARGIVLARGGGPDRSEDAGADHRADPQHDEVACAQGPLQGEGASALGEQLRDRLAGEELVHRKPGCGMRDAECDGSGAHARIPHLASRISVIRTAEPTPASRYSGV